MSKAVEGRRPTCSERLIKLAAAGVKVRERRENGVRTHCHRAAVLFASAAEQGGSRQLGLDLEVSGPSVLANRRRTRPRIPAPPMHPSRGFLRFRSNARPPSTGADRDMGGTGRMDRCRQSTSSTASTKPGKAAMSVL